MSASLETAVNTARFDLLRAQRSVRQVLAHAELSGCDRMIKIRAAVTGENMGALADDLMHVGVPIEGEVVDS